MELHQLVEQVSDEQSFLTFVSALRRDRELASAAEKAAPAGKFGSGQRGWENLTIEAFLGAAHAWATDTNFGATQNLSQASVWKRFAVFLYCGKIHE